MSDINVNTKRNAPTAPPITPEPEPDTSRAEAFAFEFPQLFRKLSEDSQAQANQAWLAIQSGNERLSAVMQGSYRVGVQESVDYATHLIETAQNNLSAACELASALMGAKTPSEIVEVASSHARRQLETIAGQNRRLWTLAQRVSSAMIEPITPPAAAPTGRKKAT